MCRCPLAIHEQNAVPGFTNSVLSRVASRIFQAFPNSFQASLGAINTGNPVRDEIIGVNSKRKRKIIGDEINLLVFGGSQGARVLNEFVPRALNKLEHMRIKVLHQSGFDDYRKTQDRYDATELHVNATVRPYIDDMAEAYVDADLVISRSGAITVSEIAAVGVISILIPYGFAVDDHQTKNAEYLKNTGAAIVLSEAELTEKSLVTVLKTLLENEDHFTKMSEAARLLVQDDAASIIVKHCQELCIRRTVPIILCIALNEFT